MVPNAGSAVRSTAGTLQGKSSQAQREAAPTDLVKMLPMMIDGFNTQARQKVPGEEQYAAEAIYEYNKQLIEGNNTPHNSYVKVTFFGNEREAVDKIENNLKNRYPAKRAIMTRNGIKVQTGYEKDSSGFYIAYVVNGFLIELHTNFVYGSPGQPGTTLEDSAWKVFSSVSRQVAKSLSQ